MPLKYSIDKLDDIEESARDFYTEKDGKFVLDVDGVEPIEAIQGLKTALAKERDAAAQYRKLGLPDEIAERIATLEAKQREEKNEGKKPDASDAALIDQLKAEYEGKISDANNRLAKVMKERASGDLKAALARAGVVPEGLDLLAAYAQSRINIEDDGSVRVLTVDGKPMLGSGADHHATLSDLAKELAEQIPHLVADKGRSGGGTPQKPGGTPDNRKPLGEWSQGEKALYIRENGLEAWNNLISGQKS